MSLAFDTSVLIAIERKDPGITRELGKLSRMHNFPVQLPFISYFEFLYGLKLRKPKENKKMLEFLNKFNVLQTTKNSAEILSDLRIKYESMGVVLPLADLLIASQVIENHLILVTMDKDFEKISELKKVIL